VEDKVKNKIFGICTLFVLAIGSPLYSLDSFANYFSTSTQQLNYNDPVTFHLKNSVQGATLSVDKKTITITTSGQYLFTFSGVGSLHTDGVGQQVGPWSIGLFRNNGLIVGTVASGHSGSDSADVLDARVVYGQAIFSVTAGDQIQIRSTTTNPIGLFATVDGGPHAGTSVTINIVKVK